MAVAHHLAPQFTSPYHLLQDSIRFCPATSTSPLLSVSSLPLKIHI